MQPTRWQQLEDLVNAAIDLPSLECSKFLDDACGSDGDLRHRAEELIASFDEAGNFLEEAIAGGAQRSLLSSAPACGDRIGPYELLDQIGRGGMGTVYRAIRADDQFRQQVAVKFVGSGFSMSQELITRFRAERQILAMLSHPNIARLIDGGLAPGGVPYLVMEFIEGETIDRFVQARGLKIRQRLDLFRRICSAIQYAHQNLIVHRDIKPPNVLVTADGEPKLLDFGIAKLLEPDSFGQTVALTTPAERLMTPGYASPEQIQGQAITTATDVYALGVLLYELLTGKPAFEPQNLTPAGMERLICETSPPRPSTRARHGDRFGKKLGSESVSPDLDNIVAKAMQKEPARRYRSAAELADDLRRYEEGFPVSARPDSWRYRASKFVSRHKTATAAAGIVAITIAVLVSGLIVQQARVKREAETSNEVAKFLGSLFESSRPNQTQGRTISVREILDRGAARVPKELTSQPLVEARLLNILATTYLELESYSQAKSLASTAHQIENRLIGHDSDENAESMQILARVADYTGDYEQASAIIREVLSIYQKTKGPDSKEAASTLNDIGLLSWRLGDFKQAQQNAREAISITKKRKGPEDKETLTTENNLEIILADAGEYSAAMPLAQEILRTRLKVLGPNHPHVGYSLSNTAFLLAKTGRLTQAEAMQKQALALRIKVYGSESPVVEQSLQNLGYLERELGRYDESQRLEEKALVMARKLIGEKSLQTAYCENDLGLTMLKDGKLQQARTLMEAALATRLAVSNPSKPLLALSYDSLGLLSLAEDDSSTARENIERGLQLRSQFYGSESDYVASSLNHLGEVVTVERDYPAAAQTFRKAIGLARAKFPGAHMITAEGLFGLGTVLLARHRTQEAEASFTESLAMRRELLPPEHPDIAASESALAKCSALLNHR